MKKIILIGTGNLGRRYVEAISKVPDHELFVFDISDSSIDGLKQFISHNKLDLNSINYCKSFTKLLNHIDSNTLIIDASTAFGRVSRLLPLINYKPKAFILEKPLAQDLNEYQKLEEALRRKKIGSYVNFTLREQPMYSYLKSLINEVESADLFVTLPKFGLFCVGIHYIDLFMYLFDLNKIEESHSVFEALYEQKRKGFSDVVGSCFLKSGKFNAVITNSDNSNNRLVQINSNESIITLFEDKRTLVTINKDGEVFTENDLNYSFVSQYMSKIINDIFKNNLINLPNVTESIEQHKVLYKYMDDNSIENLNFT